MFQRWYPSGSVRHRSWLMADVINRLRAVTLKAPFDGRTIDEVAAADLADVDAAVARARKMLQAVRGGEFPAWKRAEVLDRAARTLKERVEDFARTIALESAKPIRTARV